MNNFQPANGERARWRLIYDVLQRTRTGSLITYDEMAEILGLHPDDDRMLIRNALYRAAEELERVDKRAIDVVPNRGYEVVAPRRQLALARRHQDRATRNLERGLSKAQNVDTTGMDDRTRQMFGAMVMVLGRQLEVTQRMEERLERTENVVSKVVANQERTNEQTEEMLKRFADLERRLGMRKD